MVQYRTEQQVHRKLFAFYAWADKAKWYFRKPKQSRLDADYRIPRDEVVCTRARRLVGTQEAIYKLCELGLCNDAVALSRTAFENAISIAWMVDTEEWRDRVDMYVHYLHKVQVQGRSYFEKHDPDSEDAARVREEMSEKDREIANRLFPEGTGWARNENRKRKRLSVYEVARQVLKAQSDRAYDLFYKQPSSAVHGDIADTRPILEDTMELACFTFKAWHSRDTAGQALSNSNLAGRIMIRSLLERHMPKNIRERAAETIIEIEEYYRGE